MTYRQHAATLGRYIVVVGVLVSSLPGTAVASTAPFGQPVQVGDARQIVTVKSTRAGSSYAKLTGWVLRNGKWTRSFGPVQARVGSNGTTSSPREGKSATPRGTYTLTEAFGLEPAPAETGLPYRRVWARHWWVSDPKSRYYNTWQVGPPNGRWNPGYGEQLKRYGRAYDYSVVVDFNRAPVVKGKGSAIFVHVGTGGATAGCVSVSATHMRSLLKYLRPNLRPRIAIQ
jgi:L,D-peptidoglycan transpeptidase YkuD (ErfK/YbiS/YcfS/YnhG family)